jgi:hypothetical protein
MRQSAGSGQDPCIKGDNPDFHQKKEDDQISQQDLDSLIQSLIKSDEANSGLFIDETA